MIDHVQRYIDAVESEKIQVGKKIQLAIDRHKSDIEKSKEVDFPFYYDPSMRRTLSDLFQCFLIQKAANRNKLALFQKFILGMLWVGEEKKINTRRFRRLTCRLRGNRVSH